MLRAVEGHETGAVRVDGRLVDRPVIERAALVVKMRAERLR